MRAWQRTDQCSASSCTAASRGARSARWLSTKVRGPVPHWHACCWVNGTAFPQLELSGVKFSRSPKGDTVSGVIQQNSAAFDLVTSVPVYGMADDRQIYLGRVFAEGAETRFNMALPASVKQVVLDPYHTVLTAP